MSLLVVGSIALDSIFTPFGETADALGGSGFIVRTAADLQHMAKVIAERHAPLLIDVKLDPAATVA